MPSRCRASDHGAGPRPAPAARAATPARPAALGSAGARTAPRSQRRGRRPLPTVRAHRARHSYVVLPLEASHILWLYQQDPLPVGNPRSYARAPALSFLLLLRRRFFVGLATAPAPGGGVEDRAQPDRAAAVGSSTTSPPGRQARSSPAEKTFPSGRTK